ncbi:MAG: T9SS type A sorting domain-containing protein [Saprospiraceae bacterium]
MKTNFSFLRHKGGQMILCVTLTTFFSFFSFNASGQYFTNVSITSGQNYFQNYTSRNVSDHTIDILTLRTDSLKVSGTNSLSTSCSGYSGTIQVADGVSSSAQVNTLQISPKSIENRADYINGVTAADVTEITKYQAGLRSFTPWHLVAADADNSASITNNDKTVIQNMILGYTNDYGTYGRKSWGWVPNIDLADFINYPYYNVYGDIYVPTIYFSALSKTQITASSANYFKLHTIKIGDIISGGSGAGHNTWVCGPGGYFKEDHELQSRSSTYQNKYIAQVSNIEKGDILQMTVNISSKPDTLGSIQYSLSIPYENAEIQDVKFNGRFQPKWHYNKTSGQLVVLDYYDTPGLYPTYPEGDVMEIKLVAKQNIKKFEDLIDWSDEVSSEVTEFSGEVYQVPFVLKVQNHIKKQCNIKVLNSVNDLNALLFIPKEGIANISVYDISGKILHTENKHLSEGINEYQLGLNLTGGMYIIRVNGKDFSDTEKFIR